jgi:ABC-2 type transport system permease protein
MSRRGSTVLRIARHEFGLLMKGPSLLLSVALGALPLGLSLYSGYAEYRHAVIQNRAAEAAERIRWLNQGIKGPHAAMDQGMIVFQPLPALAAFDSGVLPFTGSEDFLVGHHQQISTSKAAEGTSTLHRLGYLTPAVTLQVLFPLALVLLLYPAFAEEREHGILRQLLSVGVSPRDLLLGKLIGLALPVAVISVVLISASVALTVHLRLPGDLPLRILMIGAGYLAYFFVISAVVLAVSARSATARQSLAISLALWFGGCVLAPVVAMDLASTLIPAPTAFDYATAEMDANRKLPTVEERRAEVRKRLLTKYRVGSLRDLPVDPIGIELLEEAEQSDPVFHNLIAGVYDADRRQNRFHQFMGALFPVIAIQQISMTIAGTDLSAHLDFLDAAEEYRRSMNRMMNEAIAYNPRYKDSAVFPGTDIIVAQAGPDLWRKVPEFRYFPSAVELLWPRLRESALLLLVWVWFAGLLLLRSTRRLTVN